MAIPSEYLDKITGPQLSINGVTSSNRYPTLNFDAGFTLTDEPTIPRYTLSLGSLEANATVTALYNMTGKPRVAVNKSVPLNGRCPFSGSSTTLVWNAGNTTGNVTQKLIDPSNLSNLYFVDLDLPANVNLTSLTASLSPSIGHAGLPSIMPGITLFRLEAGANPWDGVTKTVIASQSSSVLTVGEYNATHNISMSLGNLVTSESNRYVLQFNGEAGTNSAVSLVFNNVWINYTAPTGLYGA